MHVNAECIRTEYKHAYAYTVETLQDTRPLPWGRKAKALFISSSLKVWPALVAQAVRENRSIAKQRSKAPGLQEP